MTAAISTPGTKTFVIVSLDKDGNAAPVDMRQFSTLTSSKNPKKSAAYVLGQMIGQRVASIGITGYVLHTPPPLRVAEVVAGKYQVLNVRSIKKPDSPERLAFLAGVMSAVKSRN